MSYRNKQLSLTSKFAALGVFGLSGATPRAVEARPSSEDDGRREEEGGRSESEGDRSGSLLNR